MFCKVNLFPYNSQIFFILLLFISFFQRNFTLAKKASMEDFVHLHVHTHYSILDGQLKVPYLVN